MQGYLLWRVLGGDKTQKTNPLPEFGLESESVSHSAVSDSLRPHGPLLPARLFCPWTSPGKGTGGVGTHFLLQGIFLTQGLNSGLLHCRQVVNHLSHQGSLSLALAFSFLWEYFTVLPSLHPSLFTGRVQAYYHLGLSLDVTQLPNLDKVILFCIS